jgi:molecular chaperone GrpE
MPHRTRAEERIADIDVSPTKLLAELERLTAERDEAQAHADEYLAGLQRERAEFVNFKRRSEQDSAAAASRSADSLRLKVLDALDDFDRAIESRPAALETDAWAVGITAIDRKLRTLLEREGVRPMETSVGHPFDPRIHQAISHVSGSGRPADEVVGEFARGYLVADRVLRPALVAVSDGGVGEAHSGDGDALEGDDPDGPTARDPADTHYTN